MTRAMMMMVVVVGLVWASTACVAPNYPLKYRAEARVIPACVPVVEAYMKARPGRDRAMVYTDMDERCLDLAVLRRRTGGPVDSAHAISQVPRD